MSDNLNNEIKKSLFYDGSVTVTTTGGDITPTLIQPAQTSGLEKYNLDQRDDLNILLYAVTGTVVAGATLTVKYYNRVPNAISDAILLATETKTLAAITVGNYLATEFTNAALELADYFTVECTLKEAVGSDYTVTGNVIVKKKIVDEPATNQTAPVSETRATATYTGAANAGFILYSKLLGTAGNAITYVITTAADDNLAISVTGNAITIALAKTTASKNTATLVKAAIEAKAEANALVAVVLTGTGAGVVATQAVASLTGGLNGTSGYLGQVIFDANGNRWELEYISGGSYYWVSRNTIRTITELSAVSVSDNIIMLDSASYFSQPLPIQPIYAGKKILVKNIGTMTVKVDTIPMLPGDIVEFLSDGSGWVVSYHYREPLCAVYNLSANQSTDLAVGNLVKFDSVVGYGAYLQPSSYKITLRPGSYKYYLTYAANLTANNVSSSIRLRYTGGEDVPLSSVTPYGQANVGLITSYTSQFGIITVSEETDIEVYISLSNLTSISSVGTKLKIERIA